MDTLTTTEQAAQDTADYRAWVAGQVAYVENTLRVDVYDHGKCARLGVIVKDTGDAWAGPWFIVRNYVTTEFREMVEQGVIRRMGVTEYRAYAARERAAEQRHTDDGEQGRDALRTLATIADWYAMRGELITRARADGIPWAVICEESGLSRAQANKLALAYTRGLNRAAIADATAADPGDDWAEYGTAESFEDGEPF